MERGRRVMMLAHLSHCMIIKIETPSFLSSFNFVLESMADLTRDEELLDLIFPNNLPVPGVCIHS